jgi:hypothetical protein
LEESIENQVTQDNSKELVFHEVDNTNFTPGTISKESSLYHENSKSRSNSSEEKSIEISQLDLNKKSTKKSVVISIIDSNRQSNNTQIHT